MRRERRDELLANPLVFDIMREMEILEMGCGLRKMSGAVGVDLNPRSDADVIHDLNVFPYPFPSDAFDEVLCRDILEHLDDVVGAVREIYRVMKDGAVLHIRGPFPSGSNYPTDVTHRRAFTSRSFDYFIPGSDLYERYRYGDVHFERLECRYHAASGKSRARKWAVRWAQKHKEIFEQKYMFLIPVEDISFVLRAHKSSKAPGQT